MSDSTLDPGTLVSNQQLVEGLQKAILAAPRDLNILRMSLGEVLRREPQAFTARLDPHRGKEFSYRPDEFRKFITDAIPEGLSSNEETLRRLLGECEERVLFDLAIARGRGGANNPHGCNGAPEAGDGINTDNVRVDSPPAHDRSPAPAAGNSSSYAHRRLARARPDLLEKVKKGELSANAAMIEAGFRKVPTTLDVLRKAWAKATLEERLLFLQEVSN